MPPSPASEGTPPTPDDAELLRRGGRGDAAAFRQLVDRHGRYLHGVALSLTGRRAEDAEDLVQETLLAALKAAGGFRGEATVRTWLVGILTRQAAVQRRKFFRFPRLASRGQHDEPDDRPDSASGLGGTDAKIDLAAMLAALSVEHRQVLVLRELEHMSYEQMAETLGLPRGTVESRLFRAREELRKRFKGYL